MRRLLLILMFILYAGSATATDERSGEREPDELLVYRTAGDRDLKLHIFRPTEADSAKLSPAILFFHGGGWNSGTPTQFYAQSQYFAKHGLVAISVEYRTYQSDATPPIVALLDAKAAMRYVHSHAGELNIDPHRIIATGASAGGQLAAALAVADRINEPDADLSVSTRPNALVLFNPVVDNGPNGYGFDRVEPYWESFSPLHNVDDNHPPALFFLGTEDALIPVDTANAYKKAVEAAGSRMVLHLYEGASHGFFNESRSESHYEDTTRKAHAFLYEQGIVETPPVKIEQENRQELLR